MINTELFKPANFITIGIISVLFGILITMAHNIIHAEDKETK